MFWLLLSWRWGLQEYYFLTYIECIKNCIHCTNETDCIECEPNFRIIEKDTGQNLCLKPCPDGLYFDLNKNSCQGISYIILECLSPCKTCSVTSVRCDTCIDDLFLDEVSNTCNTCHPLCNYCKGVLNTQCFSCKHSNTITFIPPSICTCKAGYYYDSGTKQCQPCDPLCESCFGRSPNECYDCAIYSVDDDPNLCVGQCEVLGSYYKDGSTCKGNFFEAYYSLWFILWKLFWRGFR